MHSGGWVFHTSLNGEKVVMYPWNDILRDFVMYFSRIGRKNGVVYPSLVEGGTTTWIPGDDNTSLWIGFILIPQPLLISHSSRQQEGYFPIISAIPSFSPQLAEVVQGRCRGADHQARQEGSDSLPDRWVRYRYYSEHIIRMEGGHLVGVLINFFSIFWSGCFVWRFWWWVRWTALGGTSASEWGVMCVPVCGYLCFAKLLEEY